MLNQKKHQKVHRSAFSLIEVLIVVAIIALLMVSLFVAVKNNRVRAEDARIKSDLENLRIAFENYYNDQNCYPPADWFDSADDCGAAYLSPYLSSLPCSPKTDLPYQLAYTGDQCDGFLLYASLGNTSDPAVTSLCTSSGGSTLGNYGVSSSNTTVAIDCSALASPSPGASASPLASSEYPPGPYACQATTCNNYGSQAAAEAAGCPITFASSSCNSLCSIPAYQCP